MYYIPLKKAAAVCSICKKRGEDHCVRSRSTGSILNYYHTTLCVRSCNTVIGYKAFLDCQVNVALMSVNYPPDDSRETRWDRESN